MIQIGIPELLIIILVFFVAAKPEKISKYLRDLIKSFIKISSTFDKAKEDLERELNFQELIFLKVHLQLIHQHHEALPKLYMSYHQIFLQSGE